MLNNLVEMSDENLAKKWRKGVDKNAPYAIELERRGYKFKLKERHTGFIALNDSSDVIISKTEQKEI